MEITHEYFSVDSCCKAGHINLVGTSKTLPWMQSLFLAHQFSEAFVNCMALPYERIQRENYVVL